MSNPLKEFLQEKHAGGLNFGDAFRNAAVGGAAAAAVGGGAALASGAAGHLWDAATKGRDFRTMLEHNPDLHEHHQTDPRGFNQLFSSLRTFNPGFSKDPIVAGSYMRRMVGNPMAGGVLTDALSMRDKVPQHTREAFLEGAVGGARSGATH